MGQEGESISSSAASGPLGSQRTQQMRSDSGLRKRMRQSCDACKARKTKCVQTGNGPCKYCASTGATCSTSVRLQRRPYYHVSEEEYQCCMRLLRHFVPNTTLDLKTMKAMIAEIDQQEHQQGGPTSPTQRQQQGSSTAGAVGGASVSSGDSTPPIETEESEVLQEELGCMIIDARGSYRYVGADSSVRFANAISQAPHHQPRRRKNDPALMVPHVRSRLPPATPESVHGSPDKGGTPKTYNQLSGLSSLNKIYLPDRSVCQQYAMRFFDEIQSIYWFYSPEQFFTLVDRTYADGGSSASASWLCSLYCIFAICSAREEGPGPCPPSLSDSSSRRSSEYLALAKSLGVQVCDEADTDAVGALALTSLALHSSCYTVTAYLIVGMTVRMAYSLGLHRDISPRGQDSVSRARLHRLWWTVYLLDQEIAVQLGYPCAIVDDAACIRTPAACESILDPGRPTPHGYQAVCVELVKVKKKISHTLYVAPALGTRKVPFSAVTGCIGDLRDWLAKLPPHLCWSSGMSPSHRRAVAVLHLRYWTTLIHVQRPFLLYAVTRGAELEGNKKRWYEELSGLCLEAAEKSVAIVARMRESGLLSSLVLFDTQVLQDLVQVLLLGKEWEGYQRRAFCGEALETCMATLEGMESVGWCEKILPELEATVAARTALRGQMEEGTEGEQTGIFYDGGGGGGGGGSFVAGTTTWSGTTAQGFTPVADRMGDAFFDTFQDFEYNIDAQLDVFDTLDLDMGTYVQDGLYF